MTAYATNASGDWATASRWTPTGVPGNGDTATLNHVTTVSDARVIGASAAAGVVALANNAGIQIQNGGTLRVRGDITNTNAEFRVKTGGTFIWDSSLAASPATTRYANTIGTGHNQANARFVAEDGAIIFSDAGGAAGYCNGGDLWLRGGMATLGAASFTRVGDTVNASFSPDLNASAACAFTAIGTQFDNCAGFRTTENGGHHSGATLNLVNVTFRNGTGNKGSKFGSSDALSGGVRLIRHCVFDHYVQVFGPTDFTIDGWNIFYGGIEFTNKLWASFTNNLVRIVDVLTVPATPTDCFIWHDTLGANPHYLAPDVASPGFIFDGIIFEYSGSDRQGDCILWPSSLSVPTTYGMRNCIISFTDDGLGQVGTLFSAIGNANLSFWVEHTTFACAGGTSGGVVGEAYPGHAGMITSFKDNLPLSPVGDPGYKIFNDQIATGGTLVTDIVAGANADYNGAFNVIAGVSGKGYHTPTTVAPGAHDQTGNPDCIDPRRSFATWDATLGGPGTRAHAATEVMKQNDPTGYNPAYNMPAYWTYKRTGFIPRASGYRTGAHDGSVIGAVQDAFAVAWTQVIGGALTTSGTVQRMGKQVVTGTLTPAGSIRRAVSRVYAGVLSFIGAVARYGGSPSPSVDPVLWSRDASKPQYHHRDK